MSLRTTNLDTTVGVIAHCHFCFPPKSVSSLRIMSLSYSQYSGQKEAEKVLNKYLLNRL